MSIDPNLQAVLEEVRTTLEKTWVGTMGEELRPWMNFSGIAMAGKFNFDIVFDVFDRKKLNDDYLKARQADKAIVKDVWVSKISADLLAGFQRDYVMRTRSRVRFMAHTAARQKANSTAEGPVTVNTITLLAKLEAVQGK